MNVNEMLFKISATHLIVNKKQSLSDEFELLNIGAYYGKAGTKCAIGVLISAEHYDPKIEGVAVDDNIVLNLIALTHNVDISEINIRMLVSLQNIHDNFYPQGWYRELRKLSEDLDFDWIHNYDWSAPVTP